jgi:hypothetical protein
LEEEKSRSRIKGRNIRRRRENEGKRKEAWGTKTKQIEDREIE